jgi:DNA polymerase III subunit delta'
MSIYPWLAPALAQFTNRRAALPHALLLSAQAGLGLESLAEFALASILCTQPLAQAACGQCRSCQMRINQTHPDFYRISPEAGKVSIGIDAIRAVSESLSKTPQAGGYQLAVVEPAHAMTVAAANALLKTLEEPTSQTVILLVSENPGKLLPTILSRCQRIHVHRPEANAAAAWLTSAVSGSNEREQRAALALAGGSPLLAKQLIDAGETQALSNLQAQLRTIESAASTNLLSIGKAWQQNAPDFVRLYVFDLLQTMRQLAQSGAGPILNGLKLQHQKANLINELIGTGVRIDLAIVDLLQLHQALFRTSDR